MRDTRARARRRRSVVVISLQFSDPTAEWVRMDGVVTLEALASHRLVFEAISDAVFAVDLDSGLLLHANLRLEELTGHPLQTLHDHPASVLSPRLRVRRETPFGHDVYGTVGLHEEVGFARADGFVACATVRVAHTDIDGRRAAVCIARDETERRMLERELITKHVALGTAHRELEDRVSELRRLGDDLQQRKQELAVMSTRMASVSRQAMLAEVMAEVAHSMNNPLAALTSSLRMLVPFSEQLASGDPRERYGTLMERCRETTVRMARVVEDLRLACRAGAPRAGGTTVNLSEEVTAALSLLSHRMQDGVNVELRLEPDVYAVAQTDEVHHVILNLVDNALQAMQDRGTLRITCRAVNEWSYVTVADSGPGIEPHVLPAVFEPFFTTKPKGQGTGLGLSMVRRTVAHYGGSVDVDPRGELGGASFTLKLKREHAHG